MSAGGWELVTTDESAVVAKPLLDSIVVENGQGDRGLPNPARPDETDWPKIFYETNCLLDELVASKKGPRWRRRGFSRRAGSMCKITGPTVIGSPTRHESVE